MIVNFLGFSSVFYKYHFSTHFQLKDANCFKEEKRKSRYQEVLDYQEGGAAQQGHLVQRTYGKFQSNKNETHKFQDGGEVLVWRHAF